MNTSGIRRTLILLALVLAISVAAIACSKAEFELSSLEIAPRQVAIGEVATVKVDVANIGDDEGTYEAILSIDGASVETKAVSVSPGTTVTVAFVLVRNEVGAYEVAIGDLSSTLTVVGSAEFELASLTLTPHEVYPGESVTASVDISNTGMVEGTYNATLRVGGRDIESKQTTIGAGETKTVSFEFSINEAGDHTLSVNGASGSLKVINPPDFEFGSLVISPMELLAGTAATVSVEVTNVGDVEGTYSVVLKAKESGQPGAREVIDTVEVVLAGGATETVTFAWPQEVAGRYELAVESLSGTITVVEGILPTLHIGDEWVYREVNEGAVYTRTETITGEEVREGKDSYVVQVTYSPPLHGWISEKTEWRDKETLDVVLVQFSGFEPTVGGVMSRSIKTSTEYGGQPPWPKTIPHSYNEQKSVTTTDVVGTTSTQETALLYINYVISKTEQVEVPAGTFRGFKETQYEVGNPLAESWYSDIAKATVKYDSLTSDNSWELLSYTLENTSGE